MGKLFNSSRIEFGIRAFAHLHLIKIQKLLLISELPEMFVADSIQVLCRLADSGLPIFSIIG